MRLLACAEHFTEMNNVIPLKFSQSGMLFLDEKRYSSKYKQAMEVR